MWQSVTKSLFGCETGQSTRPWTALKISHPWGTFDEAKGLMSMRDELSELSFEETYAELQAAIEELRGDALSLDRSMVLFERGVALANRCDALLTKAELRITVTNPQVQPVELASDPDSEPSW
jgi:exodeoxyribonuclease VII small subunit